VLVVAIGKREREEAYKNASHRT